MSGLDDDNHASTHKLRNRTRRSMDIELHDHIEHETLPDDLSSSHRPLPDDDDDSCGGSFGEASDGCEPDEVFLAQVIQEYHPERLNLLDQSIPGPLSPMLRARKERDDAARAGAAAHRAAEAAKPANKDPPQPADQMTTPELNFKKKPRSSNKSYAIRPPKSSSVQQRGATAHETSERAKVGILLDR